MDCDDEICNYRIYILNIKKLYLYIYYYDDDNNYKISDVDDGYEFDWVIKNIIKELL